MSEPERDTPAPLQLHDAGRPYERAAAGGQVGTLADAMLAARTMAEMDVALRLLREAFALSYCRYEARFPSKGRDQELLLVASRSDDDPHDTEARSDAMDRVREHCRLSVCPLLWRVEEPPGAPGTFGAASGVLHVAVPLSSRTGDYAALHGCWGARPPMSEALARERLPELSWTTLHLHEAVRQMMLRDSLAPSGRLTVRETECLRWIAQGKTSWEIARILSVTEHTVIFHANNAMRKLGVNARAAAVQRAMSLGYL